MDYIRGWQLSRAGKSTFCLSLADTLRIGGLGNCGFGSQVKRVSQKAIITLNVNFLFIFVIRGLPEKCNLGYSNDGMEGSGRLMG